MSAMGESWLTTVWRWVKFYLVGAIGIGVQVIVLWLLRSKLHLDYLIATALAVEAAVIHNFVWHERFTWADRSSHSRSIIRFSKFNAATGLFSIAGNLLLMKTLVEAAHLQYLAANLIAIGSCSILNFIASDRFVFQIGWDNRVPPKSVGYLP
jgi:putative flippase GtrA